MKTVDPSGGWVHTLRSLYNTRAPWPMAPPLWGARYSREEARYGVSPPMAPLNLRGSLWVVLLVNLLIIWNGLLVN